MVLEESILSVLSERFINSIGFPIAAYTVVILIIVFLIRDCTTRNIQCQHSKDEYVRTFFKQSTEAQDKHIIAMHDITTELKNITTELKGVSVRIDIYTKLQQNIKEK
jgi:hypothetical protein